MESRGGGGGVLKIDIFVCKFYLFVWRVLKYFLMV